MAGRLSRSASRLGKAALRQCGPTLRVRMCVCDSGGDECGRETWGAAEAQGGGRGESEFCVFVALEREPGACLFD